MLRLCNLHETTHIQDKSRKKEVIRVSVLSQRPSGSQLGMLRNPSLME